MPPRRDANTDEIRLQGGNIMALAIALAIPITDLADALTHCGLRLDRDQLGAPAQVRAVLNGHQQTTMVT